nr:ABC transporter permease subunit [uncultured Agathobaculum sp.]
MKHFTKVLPILSIALALILDIVLPDNLQHPAAEHPYFIWLLGAALVVYLIFYAVSFFRPSLREKLEYKAYFYAGAALFLNILNLLTVKFAILPVLYFPSLDRVFGVLFEDSAFLAKCLAYSARLLFIGWFCGAIVGMLTGIAIGFNKTFSYWVQPLVRVLGPIPSTAWIPIVLIAFPSAVSASAFLIALAVWFPTTVLTSSGIAAIPNAYFEVSSTLGAGSFYRIAKVGIPAAMPHMFLGLFNGTCSSFITLVTAEMLGAKYGIGWYINWQKEMMAYANVYAGLIIIAVTFFILITLLFQFRDHVLAWQKGVIKW